MAEHIISEAKILCVKEGKCEFKDVVDEKDEYTKNSDMSDYPSDIDSSQEDSDTSLE